MRWIPILAALALISTACDDGAQPDDAPVIDAEVPEPDQTVDAVPDAAPVDATPPDAAPVDALPPEAAPDAAPPVTFEPDCPTVTPTTVDVESLGEVLIEDGASDELVLDLPADVLSVTVLIIGVEDGDFYSVTHFSGPDGEVLVDPMPPGYRPSPLDQLLGPFPGQFNSPNRVDTTATGVAGMLAPNNPGVRLAPGEWRLRLASLDGRTGRPATSAAEIITLVKRGPRLPGCGRLPIHLFFTGARGWTAESAADDADLQQAIERMRGFYAEVGIILGPITYDDVDAPRVVDANGGPDSDLHGMFALSHYETGVSLFFVERITSPSGDGIGGISGGAPGPTLQPGTVRSGVVIATALDPDPDAIGHVMGHEAGHYLGLFHTIELIGDVDQIEDTPQGRADQTNLMFPTVTSGEAHLSPQQGWVLRHNASVEVSEEE